MLNTPSSGIPMTYEQDQQIKAVEARLSYLIQDIRESEKKLESIKTATEVAEKDRAYQEQLLSDLVLKVHQNESKVFELQQEFTALTTAINTSNEKLSKQAVEHDEKHRALVSRESKIIEAETNSQKRKEELEQFANEVANHKTKVEVAHKAFKKAAESITW